MAHCRFGKSPFHLLRISREYLPLCPVFAPEIIRCAAQIWHMKCYLPAKQPNTTVLLSREETMSEYVRTLISQVKAKNPAEPEFHQAVQEVLESLEPVLQRHPE